MYPLQCLFESGNYQHQSSITAENHLVEPRAGVLDAATMIGGDHTMAWSISRLAVSILTAA
jgi:hypothetical protein